MKSSEIDSEKTKEEVNKEDADESSPLKPNPEKTEKLEKEEDKKKLSVRERLKLIKDNITVEPILICYVIPPMLSSLAIQNLYLEKACRVNLNYSAEVCDALTLRQTENYTFEEQEVQRVTASVALWKNIVQTVFPVIVMLFVGAWSDKTGKRKAIIMLPILGEILASLGLILNTYFFNMPLQVSTLAEVIFPALVGGFYTNSIGIYSYLGDITSDEDRTFRMGLLTMCSSIGYPIGTALSGVLFERAGYYGVFSVALSFHLFSLFYGCTFLKDPSQRAEKKIEMNKYGKKGFFRQFGESTVMYLITRYKFHWDDVQYSMWSTYVIITNLSGTFFAITLFSNYLKLDDALIGVISNTSDISAAFAYAFASKTWHIYLAPIIDMMSGVSYIAMQSISMKLVDGEEFGKLNSLFGLSQAIMPLIYGPLYSRVYMAMITIFPGTVFLLGALLTMPAFIIFGWMYFQHKKERSKNEATIENGNKQQIGKLK